MTRRTIAAFALLCLAGCASAPGPLFKGDAFPPSPAGLGLDLGSDPVLSAVINANSALADPPSRIGGNAAFAARIIGQYEYVTAVMREPRFISLAPVAEPQLRIGRTQARDVLGIRQDAEPGAVIAALAGAAAALDRGDTRAADAALAAVAPDPAATRARLGALPFMVRPNQALQLTQQMWGRVYALDED
ncbi:hypothetical protein [Elioraea rosea]|uniref:hypothetical protein n=1 Tax=Elioraea rosea TaxID=2492390 RepID=UPI00131512DC|nr:hypothetical protein [Elioraea rosea]